jgi:ornithine cyclodeaminase
MRGLPIIDGEEIEHLMPLVDATTRLAEMFRDGSGDADPPRRAVSWEHGALLVMPSESAPWAGVKLITIGDRSPGDQTPRIQGAYVLFDAATLAPRAILDAVALTNLRTAAVSAVATQALALPTATRLVIFGTGPQARWHARAMAAVRPIEHVSLVGRDSTRTSEVAATLQAELGVRVIASDASAVSDADIVCTCTTSRIPLFHGDRVQAHAHVNAIGSHEPDAREVDGILVARSTVVVEREGVARREAGDLIIPWQEGVVPDAVFTTELGAVLRGEVERTSGPTLFKSVGMAVEDLCIAAAIAERALLG